MPTVDEEILGLTTHYRRVNNLDLIRAVVGDASGNVQADLPGWVWVRIQSSNGLFDKRRVLPPAGKAMSLKAGSAVTLEYDKMGNLRIAEPDTQAALSGGVNVLAQVVQPTATPRITQSSLETLRVIQTSPASSVVGVKAWNVILGATEYQFSGAAVDLTSFVPASGNMRYAVIFVKSDYATTEVFASTARSVADVPLDSADIQECITAATAGSTPVWAIKLIGGQTAITQDNIDTEGLDLRQMVNTAAGGGDASGPASSTDNAIARFDGTTGKLLQNSVPTIDDTGNLSLIDHALQKVTQADVKEGAAPSSPASGYQSVYIDSSDHHLKRKNSSGTVKDIEASASPLTTKGDLYTYSSADTRLPVGSDGQILIADSAQTTGIKWGANTGTGQALLGNLLQNGSFENWENGTAAAPNAWTLTGASATVAQEATTIKHGTYSAKVTRSGTDCHLSQDAYTQLGSTYIRSRTIVFGAWVYATVASRVRLRLYDGTTTTNSSYHSGGSSWEFLTVTATVGNSATSVQVGLAVDTGNTSGYIDGVAVIEGSTISDYAPQTHEFNDFPHRATLWPDEALVLAGNALTVANQSTQKYAIDVYQSPPANGDSFSLSFFLAAGTYTMYVLGQTNSDHGKIDWYIDNVVAISGQDWYNGSAQTNITKSGSVTVIGNGYHVLKGTVNGKNGSSSNYYIERTKIWFVPSAD
jgi:hypothetical protein